MASNEFYRRICRSRFEDHFFRSLEPKLMAKRFNWLRQVIEDKELQARCY
jgi:hypothetical protein